MQDLALNLTWFRVWVNRDCGVRSSSAPFKGLELKMKQKRVVITGMGIFCSIGKNVGEFLQSLREGRAGIGPISLFDTSQYPSKIGAQIKDYHPEKVFPKKELKKLSRTDQFGLIAAEEAV